MIFLGMKNHKKIIKNHKKSENHKFLIFYDIFLMIFYDIFMIIFFCVFSTFFFETK